MTLRYQRMVLALLSIELISNLNRPRRDPSIAALNANAATPEAGRPKDAEDPAPQLKQAAVTALPLPGPAGEPRAQSLYTDESITTISSKAVELVGLVLKSDSEATQCLRYLSQISVQRSRGFSSRPSAMEDICANVVARSVPPLDRAAQETALR